MMMVSPQHNLLVRRCCVQPLLASLLLGIVLLGTSSCKRVDPQVRASHALLGEFVIILSMITKDGRGEETLDHLRRRVKRVKRYEKTGRASKEFSRRYQQMLKVSAYMVMPANRRPPEAAATIKAFLLSIAGKRDVDLERGLSEVGPALSYEVLSLRMLLDGSTDREKTRAKYPSDPL